MPTVTRPGEAEGDPPPPTSPGARRASAEQGLSGPGAPAGHGGDWCQAQEFETDCAWPRPTRRPGASAAAPVLGGSRCWTEGEVGRGESELHIPPACRLSVHLSRSSDGQGLGGPTCCPAGSAEDPRVAAGATRHLLPLGGGLTTLFRLVPLALLTGTPRRPRRPKHTGARAPRDGTLGSSGPHQQAVLGLPSLAPGSCRAPPSLRPWVPLGADPAVALPSQQRRVAARSVALVSGRCCPCVGRAREQALRSAGRGRLYFG